MFSGRWILFFLVLPLIFLTGCTRPQGETSKIQIVLPIHGNSGKAASQSLTSADELMHVVINVSGDGFTPIVYIWDSCKGCSSSSTSNTAPSSFTLDIPMGSNRLIQALAVYANSTTKSMSFYYGDTTKTLSQAQESATITISALTGATSVVTGQISGRYLTGSNQGPTGMIDIVYTPVGKPSLIIERSSIVNGWFQVFGLTGLAFGYRLPDGNLLFGKSLDLNDPVLAASTKVLRVGIPTHDRYENFNGSTSWQQEEPEIDVLGFFGPAADSTFNVCRPATLSSLTKLAKTGTTPAGSYPLTYSSSAIPTPDALLSSTTPLPSYYVEGGSSTGSCASPTVSNLYVNYLAFSSNYIDGNGRESAAGFNVPFTWDATGKPIAVDSSNPRKISGTVLPGIESLIDGFALFKKPTTDQNFRMESVDCGTLASLGYVAAGNGSVDSTARTFTITSNITATEASSGVSAILCPTRAGAVVGRGFFLQSWMFMNSGSGVQAGPPHHLAIFAPESVNSYACMDVEIAVVDSNGNRTSTPSAINLDLSSMGANGVQIMAGGPGSTCMAGTTSTYSTSIAASTNSVWVKFKGGSINNISEQINVSNIVGSSLPATMVATSKSFSVVPSGAITALTLSPGLQNRLNAGTCLQLMILSVDGNFNQVSVGSATPITVSMSSVAGSTSPLQLYSDPSCSTLLSNTSNNATFAASTSAMAVYTKAATTGFGHLSAVLTQLFSINSTPTNVNSRLDRDFVVVSTAEPTRLMVDSTMTASDSYSGYCLPMDIKAVNDFNSQIVVTGNYRLNSSGADPVYFYSDSGCSTPLTPGNLYPWSGGSMMTVYFKPNISYSSNAVTFNIDVEFQSGGSPWYMLYGKFQPVIKPVKIMPVLKVAGIPQATPFAMPYSSGTAPCAEITFELRDVTTEAQIPNKTAALIGFAFDTSPSPLSPNALVYSDATCTSSLSLPQSVIIPVNATASSPYYVKTQAGATSQAYQLPYPSLPSGIQWIPIGDFFSTAP